MNSWKKLLFGGAGRVGGAGKAGLRLRGASLGDTGPKAEFLGLLQQKGGIMERRG